MVEPYLFIEEHGERLFWKYLGRRRDQIKNIIVVGAWRGSEITALLREYPVARVFAFEASPDHFQILERTYADHPRVMCFRNAVSDIVGKARFYEGSLPGTGSLLPLGESEVSKRHNRDLVQVAEFEVNTTTLDGHETLRSLDQVDLLKIDVQGAEDAVLRGARTLLARTTAVLIEVALVNSAYTGATRFQDVDAALTDAGLTLCGLGVDPITLDGNAMYVRLSGAGRLGGSLTISPSDNRG
jgi:FkbM family methyltransferase